MFQVVPKSIASVSPQVGSLGELCASDALLELDLNQTNLLKEVIVAYFPSSAKLVNCSDDKYLGSQYEGD